MFPSGEADRGDEVVFVLDSRCVSEVKRREEEMVLSQEEDEDCIGRNLLPSHC